MASMTKCDSCMSTEFFDFDRFDDAGHEVNLECLAQDGGRPHLRTSHKKGRDVSMSAVGAVGLKFEIGGPLPY